MGAGGSDDPFDETGQEILRLDGLGARGHERVVGHARNLLDVLRIGPEAVEERTQRQLGMELRAVDGLADEPVRLVGRKVAGGETDGVGWETINDVLMPHLCGSGVEALSLAIDGRSLERNLC